MEGLNPHTHGRPWMKSRVSHGPRDGAEVASHHSDRLPWISFLPPATRGHFVAMSGEFVGTFLFLFFAYSGTQIANTTNTDAVTTQSTDVNKLLYISLCFGFSLAVNAWVFFRVSGGLFNPAVTFGMCLVGALPFFRGGLLLVSQLLGAIATAAVVSVLFPGELAVSTTLQAGTSVAQGLFIEMFLTAQLVFTIFMLAAEKHKATFIAPIGIGLSLFIAELTGVFFTGGSLNPARSLAPCVVLHSFPSYHWIYWIGPLLGAIVAAGFYYLIKKLEYETANPNQDNDDSPPIIDEEKSVEWNAQVSRSRSLSGHGVGPSRNGGSRNSTQLLGGDNALQTGPSSEYEDQTAVNSARHTQPHSRGDYTAQNTSPPRNTQTDDPMALSRNSRHGQQEGFWVPADQPTEYPYAYAQQQAGPTTSHPPAELSTSQSRRSNEKRRRRAGSRADEDAQYSVVLPPEVRSQRRSTSGPRGGTRAL